MSAVTDRHIEPQIGLRIPASWKTQKELMDQLPDGYRLDGNYFVTPDGFRAWFEPRPADPMFPNIFRIACRRQAQKQELDRLDKYRMIACMLLPGGSAASAGRILEIAATLIQAGGIGVFVDNSLIAHGAADWLELTNNRGNADAIFYTFINMKKSAREVASHGMHILGQRDGVLAHHSKLDEAISSLEEFLRMCAKEGGPPNPREYRDPSGRQFRLSNEPHRNPFGAEHPLHNPYGRWRMKQVDANQ